jgi:hypothetical protein
MTGLPEAEVHGLAVKAFIAGMTDPSNPIPARHGFVGEIDENAWYPRKDYLAMLNDLAEHSYILDMVSVGLQISRYAPMPPHVNSIESVLQNLDNSYRMGHRNVAEDEGLAYQKIDERTYYIVSRNPYLPNLEYGVIFGLVERFAPQDIRFSVYLEEEGEYPAYRIVVR